jgi:hypothetical protein
MVIVVMTKYPSVRMRRTDSVGFMKGSEGLRICEARHASNDDESFTAWRTNLMNLLLPLVWLAMVKCCFVYNQTLTDEFALRKLELVVARLDTTRRTCSSLVTVEA